MVTYLLDFHENIRFSKALSEYQEQSYLLVKTVFVCIVFLDPPNKMRVTFVGYSRNNQEIFLYLIFPEHYFGIFPGISFGTLSEYTGKILWKCFTIIPRTRICRWYTYCIWMYCPIFKFSHLIIYYFYFLCIYYIKY